MDKQDTKRAAAIFSFGGGAAYVFIAALFVVVYFELLDIDAQRVRTLMSLGFAVNAALIFGALSSISMTVCDEKPGAIVWAEKLAYAGFAIQLVDSLTPTNTGFYENSYFEHDPQGLLVYGGVGIWIFLLAIHARRNKSWPVPIWGLAFLGSISFWGVVVSGFLNHAGMQVLSAAIGGMFVAPILFVWWGLLLWRVDESEA